MFFILLVIIELIILPVIAIFIEDTNVTGYWFTQGSSKKKQQQLSTKTKIK